MLLAFWWYLCLLFLHVAFLPLFKRLFRGFPSGTAGLGIPFSLLLYAYLAWISSSLGLLPFSRYGLLLLWVISALLCWGLALWKNRPNGNSWKQNRIPKKGFFSDKDIFIGYLLGALAFFLFVAVKRYCPEITGEVQLHAAEKFPDFMMLQACVGTERLPPPDLWYAGEGNYLNHYYFGYFLVSVLTKLSGIPPAIAYNLGLATVFCLGTGASYSLATRLSGSRLGGFLGSLFLLVCGNLYGMVHLFKKGGSFPPPFSVYEFWKGSRVIEVATDRTINEFPLFSFLLGDLHPHLLALPLGLLFLAFLLSLENGHKATDKGLLSLGVGWTFGALALCNSWDVPTFGCLLFGIMFCHAWTRQVWTLPWAGAGFLLMVAVGVLLFLPYHIHYIRPPVKIKVLPWEVKSLLSQFCVVHGFFLWILLGELIWGVKDSERKAWIFPTMASLIVTGIGYALLKQDTAEDIPWIWWLLHVSVAFPAAVLLSREVLLFSNRILPAQSTLLWRLSIGLSALIASFFPLAEKAAKASVSVLLGILLLTWSIRIARHLFQEKTFDFSHLMVLLACGCLLGCEFIYLEDIYGGAAKRMNTVFKFYYQAWILLSLGCAVFATRTLLPRDTHRGLARWLWILGFMALLCGSLVYTVRAVPARCDRFQPILQRPTLDGLLYLKTKPEDTPASYAGLGKSLLSYSSTEYDTLVWMRDECETPGTLIEATGGPYTHYSRVGTFTGWPTVLGWGNHQWLWRGWALKTRFGIEGIPYQREADIKKLYRTLDTREAVSLLDKYQAEYVFVGGLERRDFFQESEHGLLKFDLFMDRIREDGEVILFGRRSALAADQVPSYVPQRPAPGAQYRDIQLASDTVPKIGRIQPVAILPQGERLGELKDLAIGLNGDIYAADVASHQIHVLSPQGQLKASWGGEGSEEGRFNKPCGLGISPNGNIFVADTWNHRVQVFDPKGALLHVVKGQQLGFWAPKDVVVTQSGEFFVVNTGQHSIHRFSPAFEETLVWGKRGSPGEFPEDLWEPVGAALGPEGNLYVTDTGHKRIQVFTRDGMPVRTWRVMGWDDFYTEPYIAFDPQGHILISDSRHDRIQYFTPQGSLVALWQAQDLFEWPIGLTFCEKGSLWVSDSRNGRVLKFHGFPTGGQS